MAVLSLSRRASLKHTRCSRWAESMAFPSVNPNQASSVHLFWDSTVRLQLQLDLMICKVFSNPSKFTRTDCSQRWLRERAFSEPIRADIWGQTLVPWKVTLRNLPLRPRSCEWNRGQRLTDGKRSKPDGTCYLLGLDPWWHQSYKEARNVL